MLLIRSQIANLLMYLLILVYGVIGFPFAMASRKAAIWIMKFYCRSVFFILRVLCGITTEFRGNIPEGKVLIASKHMSFMDIMMLMYILPQVKYIMKRELLFAPILGQYAWRIGCPAVHRGKRGKAIEDMIAALQADDDDKGQTVIFPQGTRVLPGSKQPYKVGAGVIYTRMEQTCVPVATNVGVFWARRSPYRYPGKCIMEFLDPIEPGMELREFMAKIEDEIEPRSNALMEEVGFDFSKVEAK